VGEQLELLEHHRHVTAILREIDWFSGSWRRPLADLLAAKEQLAARWLDE